MRVLIACEESQAVTKEFRLLGHEAYSCDIQECSGGCPQWHIQDDVLKIMNQGWDLMIAFPPCTHLAVAGSMYFKQKQADGRQQEGIDFFMKMINAPVEKIAVENPIGIMGKVYRKYDQIIHPYYFGDPFRKATCLWLKNLPRLVWQKEPDLFCGSSNYVEPVETGKTYIRTGKHRLGIVQKIYWQDLLPAKDRGKLKSKTFPGIAKAMAEQWGK